MTDANTPLTEASFYILLSLVPGRKHGYAILKEVEALSKSEIVMSTSTLYSALQRLQDQGMIQPVDTQRPTAHPGLPRKVYELTGAGRSVLEASLERLQRQVNAGKTFLHHSRADREGAA